MRIVADSNILAVQSHFEHLAELRLIPGRQISRSQLLDADVLLVRSITRVDEELLHGTAVKFVGTATSGIDHVDTEYLRSRNIAFSAAPGSNANAVVDYCFAALAFAVLHRGFDFDNCRVGIIGAGHVGGRLFAKLRKLGVSCVVHDPPLIERMRTQEGETQRDADRGEGTPDLSPTDFHALPDVMACDVVSLHVPLTTSGSNPTAGMINAAALDSLNENAVLIHACRGGVVDEPALLSVLRSRDSLVYIGDVWCHEPTVYAALVDRADIATPHIAGYSVDAKLAATRQLSQALAHHFGIALAEVMTMDKNTERIDIYSDVSPNAHWRLLLEHFPLEQLSQEFKAASQKGEVAAQFDLMRKRLMQRREFGAFRIANSISTKQSLFLATLGFQLS